MKKKLTILILSFLFIFSFVSCKKNSNDNNNSNNNSSNNKKISLLATSDVHCGARDNIGYKGLAEYKDEREDAGYQTVLADCGDSIQGDAIGLMTQGSDIIDIMNEMDYKFYTIGNHEFDYGIKYLASDLNKFNGSVLSCNLDYIGDNQNPLDMVKPYEIVDYNGIMVGYIGISTPESITKSTPSVFKENGEFAYSFCNETKNKLYDRVQDTIDEVKDKGANTIILLSHLGYGDEYGDIGSIPVMENVSGYDIIIDGHSHKVVEPETHKDKDGNDKTIMCLGTKLNCFGEVIIDSNGIESASLITDFDKEDSNIKTYVDNKFSSIEAITKQVVSTSDLKLDIYDSNGIRLPRNRETQIGNFYADAFRDYFNSDIAFINGGGIRAGFDVGNITYETLYKMAPFGNFGCVIEATGQQILDYLEMASRLRETATNNGTKAVGENGGFAVPSGLKYTIDTSIPTPVVVDTNNFLVKIEGERRVKDVYILEDDTYVALDSTKKYKIATISYIAMESGDGNSAFEGASVCGNVDTLDVDVLKAYFEKLNGNIKVKYENIDGRITII